MLGQLAALVLLSSVSVIQTAEVLQQMSLTVVEVGDNLTLTCQGPGAGGWLFYWYKFNYGYVVQTVAAGTYRKIELEGQFNNSRFTILNTGDLYALTILNVSKEDEATYFCQAGEAYIMTFVNGTYLAVNDHKNQQKHVYVKQSPEAASVQLGDSVTLQCSLLSRIEDNSVQCPGEDSVHWFRSGSDGSHPGTIYTHSDRGGERSCVYSLSKTIKNSSDAGTYYCAVVTCGEILLGEGTKVETRQGLSPFIIGLGTLMLCSIIMIVALLLSRKQKPVCHRCKGAITAEHDGSPEDQRSNVDSDADALNYVALDFTSRKATRGKNKRDFPEDCIYSGIRK